jgi:hypothetical protein
MTYNDWYKQEKKGKGKRTLQVYEFNKMKIDDYIPSENFYKYLEPTLSSKKKVRTKLRIFDPAMLPKRRAKSAAHSYQYIPKYIKNMGKKKKKFISRPRSTDYFMKPYSKEKYSKTRKEHKKICKLLSESPNGFKKIPEIPTRTSPWD